MLIILCHQVTSSKYLSLEDIQDVHKFLNVSGNLPFFYYHSPKQKFVFEPRCGTFL